MMSAFAFHIAEYLLVYVGIVILSLNRIEVASFTHRSEPAPLSVIVYLRQSCNIINHYRLGHSRYISYALVYPFNQNVEDEPVQKSVEAFPSECMQPLLNNRNITFTAQLPDGSTKLSSSLDYMDYDAFTISRILQLVIEHPMSRLSNDESAAAVYQSIYSLFQHDEENLEVIDVKDLPILTAAHFVRSLQAEVKKICEVLNSIDQLLCRQFRHRVKANILKQIEAYILGMPSVQWDPSPQDAFVYLHIEKTGGTTLRELIVQSAGALGRNVFVPCYHGLSCLTFTHPATAVEPYTVGSKLINHIVKKNFPVSNLSVFGGHFSWDIWSALPTYRVNAIFGQSSSTSALPHILVINRHPIERIISYFYQRCYDLHHCNPTGKLLREWTEAELDNLIISYRAWYVDEDLQRLTFSLQKKYEICLNTSSCPSYDASEHELVRMTNGDREAEIVVIDDGMANAACRAILNKKSSTDTRFTANQRSYVLTHPTLLTESDTQEALRRVDQVVVGLQEHWADSIAVINFFFPWINFAHKFDYVKMPSKHRSLDSRASLPKQLIAVIEKHNACDLALYAKMEHSFAKQRGVVLGV